MPGWHLNIGRRFEMLRRYRHIIAVLMKYGFEEAADVLRSRFSIVLGEKIIPAKVKSEVQGRPRAVRMRMAMEELGPTFVKLGQLLSTRPDLLPNDYIEELSTLQDRVSPENFELVRQGIEKALGGRIEDIFAEFNPIPIAAGSIAQVHRATTKDGRSVVVKVSRPNIRQIVSAECKILEDMAGLLKAAFFEKDTIDPQKMVREVSEAISKEVDLENERHNQMRFLQNFANDPAIHVPKVYEEYCAASVLTMEYIEGIKPGKADAVRAAGFDPKIIAKRGADFVVRQIFEFGFFHTDPHPGNFFLLPDNVLAPIDFGQVARLSSSDRKLFNEIILAVVDEDAEQMVRAFEKAEMMSEKTDSRKLTSELEMMLASYHNLPLKDIPFSKVIAQTFDLIRKYHVQPPAHFTLMLKCIATIENFAVSLDPEFQIIDHIQPYARQFSLKDIDPKLIAKNAKRVMGDAVDLVSRLPDDLNAILNKFRQGNLLLRVHHEHLETLVKTMDKSSNRISFALIIAAILIASSMLVSQEGSVLGVIDLQTLGIIGYIAAAIIGSWLLVSIIRSRHL